LIFQVAAPCLVPSLHAFSARLLGITWARIPHRDATPSKSSSLLPWLLASLVICFPGYLPEFFPAPFFGFRATIF
jgi:hypothetical protein